jgi:predicted Zn-dependent protease
VLGAVLDQLLYGPGLPDLGRLGTLPGRAAAVAGWAAVASGRLPASPVAVQLLEQVNGILGPRPAVMLTLGQTLAKLDRKAQAATWLLRAAQARPKNTAAWLEAVTLLVDLRKVEQAVRILDKGIAANPGVAALTHARARLGVLLIGA